MSNICCIVAGMKEKEKNLGFGTFDPDKDMTVNIEDPFRPLDFKPYPCHRCGELVKCGLMYAVNHFNTCKKNKIII